MVCSHIFKGHAGGVTCRMCGLRMSAEEYAAYLSKPTEGPDKPKRGKRKKEDQTNE